MLTLTDNARTVIRRLVTRVDGAKRGGLRIGRPSGSEALGVELAAAPEAGDEVVETGGVRVFIEAAASAKLAEKELDAIVDEESVQFSLRDRMRVVP